MGIHSSREIAKGCVERVDFRFLTGGLTPSFSTITKFRADHAEALAGLFSQSVSIAMKDALVEMSDVAFDGTKVLANASKHKAMSYQRMCERVQQLHTEIEDLKEERRTATGRRQKRSSATSSSSDNDMATFKSRSSRLKISILSRVGNYQRKRINGILPIQNQG